MAKDAFENSEKEPNNHELFSNESMEDQNENRNVVSSMEEGPFEIAHMNSSLSTNDDPSNTFEVNNTGLVQNATNLQDNNVSVETGATVNSSADIEKSAKNVQLKFYGDELPSSTSDNGHKTVCTCYFYKDSSTTKNASPIFHHCGNREEMFKLDCIPNILEEEQSSIKTQINECINTLNDITDKISSSSSSPIRNIELSSDINKTKPRDELAVDNTDPKENSSSNTTKNLHNKINNFLRSPEIPYSTNYALRSHSNVILSEEEGNLKEKDESSSKGVKEYEDKNVIGTETDKSASPENNSEITYTNSDAYGYKSESMPKEPESIIALIQAYKSEKCLKIVQKFFDSENSLKADKMNLNVKTDNANLILEASRQCSNEVTNDNDCLNQTLSHDKDSYKEIEMNELCKDHTTVLKKNFNDSIQEESIETTILLSEKSCSEEMNHKSDVKEQGMSISFEKNSEQLGAGTQESHNKDVVGNPVNCTNIESTNNNYEENCLSKLTTKVRSPLKKFLPSPDCTKEHSFNKKENFHYFGDDPFQNQMSSDTPMTLSNTDEETLICKEVNETNQDNQLDPSVPLWLERDTDPTKYQYPFEEPSLIQQPEELMATEVVKEEPSDTPLMLSNTNKENLMCDEVKKTPQDNQSDPSVPLWLHCDTDQSKYQYPLEESSFIQQPEELMAADVVKEEPDGIEIGSYLDQYSGDGDIFDGLRNLNRNVDFTSFDNIFSSDVTYPTFDSLEPTFQIDRFSTPLDSSSSSKGFSKTSNSIKEGRNFIQDKKKNSANLRIQILSRKEKPTLGTFYDNSESFNNLTQSSSPVYGTIKIRTPGNGTTFQSFSFSPAVDKNAQQYSIQNKAEHTCLGVLRPIKKGVRIEGGEPGIPSGTRRVVFAEKTIERENGSGFTKYKVMPSVKLIVPKEISQVNTKTESEKNEKENSRIKVYPCTAGAKGKDGTGSVISYFSKAAGLIPSSSSQKLEMDNIQAKSLGPKRNNDAKPNDGKPSANCSPKLNLLHAVAKELTTESRSETNASSTNRKATPLPTTMISSRTRSKRLSLTEETNESNTAPSRTSKRMRSSDGEVKTPPIIKISEIVDNYAAKFHNASAALQQRIPKKDFSKKQLLEKVFQSQASVSGESNERLNTEKAKTISDLTLAAVQELNGGQGSTVFDIMSYVRSRVSRNDANVSQGVRETLKEAAGVGNIQLKSGRYVVTQTLTGKEKAKPKNVKRKNSAIELPRRTKSLRIFRKPYDENDPCL